MVYAPQIDGFWLGDDFNKVESSHRWVLQGSWPELLKQQFSHDIGGNFYRPLTVISLRTNYLLAGSHYAGWFVPYLIVHLCNGLLVFGVVRRLLALQGNAAGNVAPAYAAAAFLLCPFLAEGVFWLCAPDRWVTFFTLLGVYLWLGQASVGASKSSHVLAWSLPMTYATALLFKESAAILPLQVALLWLAASGLRDRHRSLALLVTFALMGLYFVWRNYLFGDPFTIYVLPEGASEPFWLTKLLSDLTSLGRWLQGLMGEQYFFAASLFALQCLLLLGGLVLHVSNGKGFLLALATSCAAGGLFLATILNLGGLAATGEGGRLVYSPLAWFFIASGVALGALPEKTGAQSIRSITGGLIAASVLLGLWLTSGLIQKVHGTQSTMREMVQAMPALVDQQSESGKGLLLLPDTIGPVIAFRNSQSDLVSPPLMERKRLDEMVPTMMQHLDQHHATWNPAWVACWVGGEREMQVIWAGTGTTNLDNWPDLIREKAQQRRCAPL